jgi:putative endonuclease
MQMERERNPAVYILASQRNGTLYTGVTSELWNRVAIHKSKGFEGFTSTYNVNLLVWYEFHLDMDAAIKREKQIKKWYRRWKLDLIEAVNPGWDDLHDCIDYERFHQPSLGPRVRGDDGRKVI